MSRDLTIRLLGRPQVSSDKRTGFSKVSRRYVVQGPRATLAGIVDSTNPLFLPYGSTDEEFTDQFERINAVAKVYRNRDDKSPVTSVKMIKLDRRTLPLYKRLDEQNNEIVQKKTKRF